MFRSGTHISNLPATHQDAIAVTRGLGLRYLWIDALCIIQDSDEDKAREIHAMHDVYSNAHFVVAAVAAMDSSQHFLVEQHSMAMSACFLNVRGTIKMPDKASWSSLGGVYATTRAKAQAPAADELHLSRFRSRGWIFQEERLARRVMYFCDHKVMARCNDCRQTFALDRNLGGLSKNITDPFLPRFSDLSWLTDRLMRAAKRSIFRPKRPQLKDSSWQWTVVPEDENDVPSEETEAALQGRLWWKLVERYTERILTVSTDKLPALQGLATRFEQKLNAIESLQSRLIPVQYSFGLWVGEYFVSALLWYLKDAPSERPPQRAPSWSWAAVDGIITNDSLEADTCSTACQVSIVDGPTNETPRVVVKAVIKSATWHRLPEQRKLYYVGHSRSVPEDILRHQDLARYIPLTKDVTQGPEAHILRAGAEDVGFVIWDTLDRIPREGSEVTCVQIIVQPRTKQEKESFGAPWATRGLVVLPTDTDPNTYHRIGYFELRRTPGGIAFPTSLAPAQQKAYRYPAPNIDVGGFFRNCVPTTVTIL